MTYFRELFHSDACRRETAGVFSEYFALLKKGIMIPFKVNALAKTGDLALFSMDSMDTIITLASLQNCVNIYTSID
jgi:uncharacterized membrane protein (DUF2068 family)